MTLHWPIASYTVASQVVDAGIAANVPVLLVGPPGVGKSALVEEVAARRKMPCHVLLGSTLDPTDVGGLPVVLNGKLNRIPLSAIRACAEEPGVLFLDELSACTPAVESALLRLVYERIAGDVRLHPESRIVCAANPSDQAPGAHDLAAAMVGRVTTVGVSPTVDEIRHYFREILPTRGSSAALTDLARDFAATTAHETRLIEIDPPSASVTSGAPWGAPRSWERGLRGSAASSDPTAQYALLAGAVGERCATSFLAIREMRKYLPTAEEICQNPESASVPSEPDKQIAALGLLDSVARKESWAAWIYAKRMRREIGIVAARFLIAIPECGPTTWRKAGKKCQIELLGSAGAALGAI